MFDIDVIFSDLIDLFGFLCGWPKAELCIDHLHALTLARLKVIVISIRSC